MLYPDEVVFFSGDSWGVRISDYMRGIDDDDFWNVHGYFMLASDGEIVQALVIRSI